MNCPKCGSTNITEEEKKNGFYFCLGCYFKWKDNFKQPEPTPQEMLWWLVENYNVEVIDDSGLELFITGRINGKCLHYHIEYDAECKTLTEAVRAAYKKAKEQR